MMFIGGTMSAISLLNFYYRFDFGAAKDNFINDVVRDFNVNGMVMIFEGRIIWPHEIPVSEASEIDYLYLKRSCVVLTLSLATVAAGYALYKFNQDSNQNQPQHPKSFRLNGAGG